MNLVHVSTRPILLTLAVCLAITSAEISARETPAQTASPAVVADTKSFDPAAATQAWLASVPREQREKSDAYFEGGYWLLLWNFLLVATLSFPLSLYENFFREHQYGFATQTLLPWFREQLIGLGLAIIGGTILLIALYTVFRRAPGTWWIWGTGAVVIFLFVVVFIAPVFIEPLFNTYKPLTTPEIRNPILAMAQANQIPAKQVFEVDASRQTTRVSANVSGLLGTTRIALNDNLLKKCTLPEIRMVMAHEMGHFVLNHGAKLLTYFGIFILIGFALTRTLFNAAVKRWAVRWSVRGIADPAGLPLLVLIFSTLLFIATPFLNTVVRVTEREADAFGINTSREADGMAKAALKLGAYRKLDPTPLEEFIFFDHPSGRARIRMAMDWKAASLPCGESAVLETVPPTRQ